MKERVIIFGSSGHARSIAVILEELGHPIVGFINSYEPAGVKVLAYHTLGDESVLADAQERFGTHQVVLGIGDLAARKAVRQKLELLNPGLVYPTIISPRATVAAYGQIGAGTVVFSNAFVNVECRIGEFCVVNSAAIVEHNTVVEDYCTISPAVNIGGDVHIEREVFIGSSATIIQKRRIGRQSVVAAGAVVVQDVPERVLLAGVPGRIKRHDYQNNNLFR